MQNYAQEQPGHGIQQAAPREQQQQSLWGQFAVAAFAATLAFAPMAVVAPAPAFAADTVKIGTCLLQKCQVQLAQCLGDAKCLQNIVCLNQCNSAEDEAACQIR